MVPQINKPVLNIMFALFIISSFLAITSLFMAFMATGCSPAGVIDRIEPQLDCITTTKDCIGLEIENNCDEQITIKGVLYSQWKAVRQYPFSNTNNTNVTLRPGDSDRISRMEEWDKKFADTGSISPIPWSIKAEYKGEEYTLYGKRYPVSNDLGLFGMKIFFPSSLILLVLTIILFWSQRKNKQNRPTKQSNP